MLLNHPLACGYTAALHSTELPIRKLEDEQPTRIKHCVGQTPLYEHDVQRSRSLYIVAQQVRVLQHRTACECFAVNVQ